MSFLDSIHRLLILVLLAIFASNGKIGFQIEISLNRSQVRLDTMMTAFMLLLLGYVVGMFILLLEYLVWLLSKMMTKT